MIPPTLLSQFYLSLSKVLNLASGTTAQQKVVPRLREHVTFSIHALFQYPKCVPTAEGISYMIASVRDQNTGFDSAQGSNSIA